MSTQVLNDQTFAEVSSGWSKDKTAEMTYGGVIAKSAFLLTLTVACGFLGWNLAADAEPQSGLWFFLGFILLIALTFAAAGNPRIAAPAGIVYALLMGTWMGSVSRLYEDYYDGIVGAAIMATLAVFLGVLLLYSVRAIRVTGRFTAVIMISLVGILLLYLFGFVMELLGVNLNFVNEPTPLGFAIQIFIVIIAALSLSLDFNVIETGVEEGAPKDYEWYAAFGLQTTLVWLYLEVLRLLALFAQR